jgi:hypothetical protein
MRCAGRRGEKKSFFPLYDIGCRIDPRHVASMQMHMPNRSGNKYTANNLFLSNTYLIVYQAMPFYSIAESNKFLFLTTSKKGLAGDN